MFEQIKRNKYIIIAFLIILIIIVVIVNIKNSKKKVKTPKLDIKPTSEIILSTNQEEKNKIFKSLTETLQESTNSLKELFRHCWDGF